MARCTLCSRACFAVAYSSREMEPRTLSFSNWNNSSFTVSSEPAEWRVGSITGATALAALIRILLQISNAKAPTTTRPNIAWYGKDRPRGEAAFESAAERRLALAELELSIADTG